MAAKGGVRAEGAKGEAGVGEEVKLSAALGEELLSLKRELQRERHRNSQLEHKLKRQAKAQELMVSSQHRLPD
ncbi:MAG: hypothetical protein SGPRY_013600 [Prymnesium sp.]